MKNGKIKIGIIGAGNVAQNFHIPAFLKQKDAELAAVCDIKLERAKQVAEKYDIKHAVKDYNELLALDDVDAVSICTWNNSHAPIAIAAARAGKHILCEKPMALTVAEGEAMAEAAKKSGKVFMMGFVNRFRAETKVLKALADEGKFGEIYCSKAGWLRRRGTPLGWFTDTAKSGGGPVIDIGVHVIDLTWYLMGKPKPTRLSASVFYKIGDYKTKGVGRWVAFDTDDLVFNTEDSAQAIIHFENGATMLFDVSWAINGEGSRDIYSHIYGTKAGASLDPLMIYGEDGGYLSDSAPKVSKENNFENEIRHFLDCIKEGKQPIATAEDGLQIQKILNGIYESARLGKEIEL